MIMTHNGNAKFFKSDKEAESYMFETVKDNSMYVSISKVTRTYPDSNGIVSIHVYQYNTLHQDVFVVMDD